MTIGGALSRDNVSKVTDPEGRETGYTYNARGQVRLVRDARGNVTENIYDGANGKLLQTEVRAPDASVVSTYWPDGNVRTQQVWSDIASNLFCETAYEYCPAGWLQKETDAAATPPSTRTTAAAPAGPSGPRAPWPPGRSRRWTRSMPTTGWAGW